jgi:hypothetical protein
MPNILCWGRKKPGKEGAFGSFLAKKPFTEQPFSLQVVLWSDGWEDSIWILKVFKGPVSKYALSREQN